MIPPYEKLVQELIDIGQTPVDAHRNAFVALACAQTWTKARIGKWLGISRARVGQKYDKLAYYATHRSDVPCLTDTIAYAESHRAVMTNQDNTVAFDASDWDDLDRAKEWLQLVSSASAV